MYFVFILMFRQTFKVDNVSFFKTFWISLVDSDAKALMKERQKKDNHNLSKSSFISDILSTCDMLWVTLPSSTILSEVC